MGKSEPPSKRKKTIHSTTTVNTAGDKNAIVAGPSNQHSLIPRNGRIERVQLINFMCHANFVVEFNKNINIFVGCNGSGKSAIITGVVIGLGGNAAAAERSKNIGQLIRRGERSASIEITLFNDGIDSYEKEKYGNRIIVHRQISSNGTSQYRIKNGESGVTVSQSLRDLQNMVTYMNIQVANPICVLNQDAARSFLKEADPRKRYLLFFKASQLEKIIQILDEAVASFRISKSKLVILKQKLEKQIKKYNDTKDLYECLMSVETLKGELQNLKIELEWTKVREEEMKYEAIKSKLDEINSKMEELKSSIDSWSDNMRRFNEEKENRIAELNETKATITTNRTAHDELRTSLTDWRNQLARQEAKHKSILDKLKRLKKEMTEIQKSIDDRESSNQVEILRRENEEKLQILITERNELRSTETDLKQTVQLFNTKAQDDESNLDDLQHKQQEAKQNMDKIKREINQIDGKNNDNFSIFGTHMPKLIGAIEQHHKRGKFSELPRGPIGRYIQVKNKKWSQLVEHILGGQLQYFVFNTHEDSKYFDTLLKKEFSQIKANISKIVTKFCHTPYDVRSNMVKVRKGSATILLEEITVSDPVVLNVLIDQVHIEAILMCSGNDEACQYTTEQSMVPKNLSKIFSLEPAAEYFPAPNFRSYGLNVRPSRLLQTDMQQYKVQLEQELVEATTQFKDAQSELNKCQMAVKHSSAQLAEQRSNLSKVQQNLKRVQNKIQEIESFEYPAQHEVDVLQNELNELQTEYDTINSSIENQKQDTQMLQQQVKAIEQNIKVNQVEAKKLHKIVIEKTELLNGITEKIDNLAINNVETDLKRCENDRQQIAVEETKQHSILAQATKYAAEKGERIDKNRAENKIKSLITTTVNKIQKQCASTDDITSVKTLMLAQENDYKRTAYTVKETKNILQTLTSNIDKRYHYLFYKYRPSISINIQKKFISTLQVRKYGGDMRIDHEHKLFDIEIVPHDRNIEDAVSNTKSLSGGERSYSTVAFLTSLWSCVSSPFYFLDEYDVFTDQINRQFMAQLLISEARRRSHEQFCFFTPQDMSFIKESDLVTFHRLESHLKST